MRTPIAVFLSGGGRTLENLLACARGQGPEGRSLDADIRLVVASRECRGTEVAREATIETRVIPGDLEAPRVHDLLTSCGVAWGVLAGYLRRLGIPPAFEHRVVNIHPALLPAHGGKGMFGDRVHRAVLEAGETRTGCTVHLCDERYDTGPIVLQRMCDVLAGDTPTSLGARVFKLEKRAYPEALSLLFAGGWRVEGGRVRFE